MLCKPLPSDPDAMSQLTELIRQGDYRALTQQGYTSIAVLVCKRVVGVSLEDAKEIIRTYRNDIVAKGL